LSLISQCRTAFDLGVSVGSDLAGLVRVGVGRQ
jgi:hypothetical protein